MYLDAEYNPLNYKFTINWEVNFIHSILAFKYFQIPRSENLAFNIMQIKVKYFILIFDIS